MTGVIRLFDGIVVEAFARVDESVSNDNDTQRSPTNSQ